MTEYSNKTLNLFSSVQLVMILWFERKINLIFIDNTKDKNFNTTNLLKSDSGITEKIPTFPCVSNLFVSLFLPLSLPSHVIVIVNNEYYN